MYAPDAGTVHGATAGDAPTIGSWLNGTGPEEDVAAVVDVIWSRNARTSALSVPTCAVRRATASSGWIGADSLRGPPASVSRGAVFGRGIDCSSRNASRSNASSGTPPVGRWDRTEVVGRSSPVLDASGGRRRAQCQLCCRPGLLLSWCLWARSRCRGKDGGSREVRRRCSRSGQLGFTLSRASGYVGLPFLQSPAGPGRRAAGAAGARGSARGGIGGRGHRSWSCRRGRGRDGR